MKHRISPIIAPRNPRREPVNAGLHQLQRLGRMGPGHVDEMAAGEERAMGGLGGLREITVNMIEGIPLTRYRWAITQGSR